MPPGPSIYRYRANSSCGQAQGETVASDTWPPTLTTTPSSSTPSQQRYWYDANGNVTRRINGS